MLYIAVTPPSASCFNIQARPDLQKSQARLELSTTENSAVPSPSALHKLFHTVLQTVVNQLSDLSEWGKPTLYHPILLKEKLRQSGSDYFVGPSFPTLK